MPISAEVRKLQNFIKKYNHKGIEVSQTLSDHLEELSKGEINRPKLG